MYLFLDSGLALILVRHSEKARIKDILNKQIPQPSYTSKDQSDEKKKKKKTTLFRELVCRMPGKQFGDVSPQLVWHMYYVFYIIHFTSVKVFAAYVFRILQ